MYITWAYFRNVSGKPVTTVMFVHGDTRGAVITVVTSKSDNHFENCPCNIRIFLELQKLKIFIIKT